MSRQIQVLPTCSVTDVTTLSTTRAERLYISCDTEGERPTAGDCRDGDLAFTLDSGKLWKVAANAWVDLGTPNVHAITHETGGSDAMSLLLTRSSGVASSSGNNTCVSPSAGKQLRIYYVAYNPAAAVEAAYRFGAAGALFLRNNLTVGGAVIAKDFGDFRYVQGAIDEALILNLSDAISTVWNVFYIEV